MRTLWLKNKYEGFIKVDDGAKKIIKLHCTCKSFEMYCRKKIGNVSGIKYYAVPCKHLLEIFDTFVKQGYVLKIPFIEKGPMKCSAKLRKQILEVWGNECFQPNCEDENVEIHRLIPATQGGAYTILNCRPLCNKHHQLVTYHPWHRK